METPFALALLLLTGAAMHTGGVSSVVLRGGNCDASPHAVDLTRAYSFRAGGGTYRAFRHSQYSLHPKIHNARTKQRPGISPGPRSFALPCVLPEIGDVFAKRQLSVHVQRIQYDITVELLLHECRSPCTSMVVVSMHVA